MSEWSPIVEKLKDWFSNLPESYQEEVVRMVVTYRPKQHKLRDIMQLPKGDEGFDFDVVDGAESEILLKGLSPSFDKIEVKTDYLVSETQNVAVEFWNGKKSSGIGTSKASHWAFVLDGPLYKKEVIIIVAVDRLKQLCVGCGKRWGGDGKRACMYLLPISKLVSRL